MQNQALSLREKARRSFEARKSDHQARLAFLKDAKILDASGNYNDQFFSKSSTNTEQIRAKQLMYSRRSNLVLGFHGLDESIGKRIIAGNDKLLPSENDYDWLGHGIYFWENSLARAQMWAEQQSKRKDTSVKKPFAIGATIDLGNCLDLLDQYWLDYVGDAYTFMVEELKAEGKEIPENTAWTPTDIDFKKRELDCAVILYAIQMAEKEGEPFDSVRAAFWEGEDLYPNAGFKQHSHIQISIINPQCIRGIFLPKQDI